MDTEENVRRWLISMQYTGEIPKNLSKYTEWCNPATAPLWNQICDTIAARDKIRHKRNTLLVKRIDLHSKGFIETYNAADGKILAPMREITLWRKKNKLLQEISELEVQCSKEESVKNKLKTNNNVKLIHLCTAKKDTEELKIKRELLEQNKEELQEEISTVKNRLSEVKSLIPVENSDKEIGNSEVQFTLRKCAEKLEAITLKSSQNNVPKSSLSLSSLNTSNITLNDMPNKYLNLFFENSARSTKNSSMKNDLLRSKIFHRSQFALDDSLGTLNGSCDDSLLDTQSSMITKNIKEDIEGLMHKYPRQFLANQIEILNVELMDSIRKLSFDEEDNKFSSSNAIKKIYAKHIQKSLELFYSKSIVKKLENNLQSYEKSFCPNSFNNSDDNSLLSKKAEVAGIKAVNLYIKKELLKMPKNDTSKDLKLTESKIKRSQHKLECLETKIEQKLSSLEDIYSQIMLCKEDIWFRGSSSLLLDCIGNLLKTLLTDELNLLLKYPLEFNRKIETQDGKKIYAREVFDDPFENLEHANSEILSIFKSPSLALEFQILQIYDKKLKIKHLLKEPTIKIDKHTTKYTKADFEKIEKQIEPLETQVNVLQNNINKKTHNCNLKEQIDFYKEIPIRHIISETKLFEGKPYKYYENEYMKLMKSL